MIKDAIKKATRVAATSLAFLCGLFIFVLLVGVGTEAGSKATLETALKMLADTGYRISFEEMNGTLLDEITFQNLGVFEVDSGLSVTAGNVVLSWNPFALLEETLQINDLQFRQVIVDPPAPDEQADTEPDIEAIISSIYTLPVAIVLENAGINNLIIRAEQTQRIARIVLAGGLDQQALDLRFTVDQDAVTGVSGRLNLKASSFALESEINWKTVIAEMNASGALELVGNLSQLNIQHELAAPLLINSSGTVLTGLLDANQLSINLQHNFTGLNGAGLNFPFAEKLQDLDGSLTTSGTIERLAIQGELNALVQDFGELGAAFDVNLAPGIIQLEQINLDSERLTINTSGNYSLGSTNSLALDWELQNFTDGDLFQDIEIVSVLGNGSIDVDFAADLVRTSMSINELSGDINNFPLAGSGNLVLLNDQVEDLNINLLAGGNALTLNGALSPVMELDWSVQAPVLERLMSTLEGEVNGQGRLSGSIELPRIDGSLSGANIRYEDESLQLQLDSLQAQARYDGSNNQVELTFANLVWGEEGSNLSLMRGELALSGTLPSHEVRIDTDASLFELQLEAAGGYQEETWDGVISSLALQSSYGDLMLNRPLGIIASAEQATLSDHCWAMTSFTLCGQAGWEKSRGLSGEMTLDNFPISFLNDRQLIEDAGLDEIAQVMATRPAGIENLLDEHAIALPENGFIDGRIDVESTFSGVGGDWAESAMDFIVSPRDLVLGVVIPAEENAESAEPRVESYGLDDVRLSLHRANAQWLLDSSFQVYVPESGGLDFQGAFTGKVTLDDNETLAGDFELGFNNIAWLEALVPSLLSPAGELEASGELAGTLSSPVLLFDSKLVNGSFELPEYGLTPREINLELRGEQDNQITIAGSAISGDGQVSFNSVLTRPFDNSRTLVFEIAGEKFQVINSPGTLVSVSPDLVLNFADNVLDIRGSLLVPQFELDVSNNMALLGNGSISNSRDVILINIPPELEDSVNKTNEGFLGVIPVTANLVVSLGEQVHFRGYGLDLNLTGDLSLEQTRDRPMLAYGELGIPSGSYSMYGQRLLIEDGKLLFLGNPLNPAVDIRATRSTSEAEVGLQLNGTINNLQGQLFSTPALPESEVLSLLITGRSFRNAGNQDGTNMLGAIANLGLEKGQGLTSSVRNSLGLDTVEIDTTDDYRDSAIGLGKYINPDIFIRYDIGLFDREDRVSVEYSLTETLKLEVGSGVSQSIDLTYTVEK